MEGLLVLLAVCCWVAGMLIGYWRGYSRATDATDAELRRLTGEVVTAQQKVSAAEAEVNTRQKFIDGLWMPKECKEHVYPREPVFRKNVQGHWMLKFLCMRCGAHHWQNKGA